MDSLGTRVTDAGELREIIGSPMPRAVTKERTHLHPRDREWLAASPFCLIASAAADGSCDVSPKGDPPGFVHVVDDVTIAIPDRPGNGRADGFHNVLANPHVGLIFLVPGRGETLRINGRAELLRDAPFFADMTVNDHRPRLVLLVHVEQVFLHCAKAFMRSHIWDPQTWRPDAVASNARMIKDTQTVTESLDELEDYYGPSYAERLYRER